MSRTQKIEPRTAVWTGAFCIVAGGVLLAIDSWFGWAPLTFGVIILLVGLVARQSVQEGQEG